MAFADRLRDIRTGFERPFWVANISEIFERISYYAVFAVLVRYLIENLKFPTQQATTLGGIFGGAVWIMAIFGGALADRIGFRRALSLAYFILSCAYFLVGSIGNFRDAVPASVLPIIAGIILFLPALGVALVKPSVVGTTARSSNENVRSIGYSIYYTMVNIGSFFGPYLAGYVHEHMRVENVFRLAALSVFLMFIGVLIFFKEPRRAATEQVPTVAQVMSNFGKVLRNGKFVLFLLIFSGYWIVFWQQYLILPKFVHNYVDASANTEYILITDPLIVITCTILMNALTKRIPAFRAVVLGSLLTSVGWLAMTGWASKWAAVLALAIVALGEIIQSPRYYEYISRLAPEGQQGTYMGFAFLPIGIGSLIGGPFSGWLLNHYGEQLHKPNMIWFIVTGVGVLTTVLLYIYDLIVKPTHPETEAASKAA